MRVLVALAAAAPVEQTPGRAEAGTGLARQRALAGLVHLGDDLPAAARGERPVRQAVHGVDDDLDLPLALADQRRVPRLPEHADQRDHAGLVHEPDAVPAEHLVGRPLARDVLDGLLGDRAARVHGRQVLVAGLPGLAAAVRQVQEHRPVEHDAQVLVPPLHHAAGRVDGFRAGFGGAEDPGEVVVPGYELGVEAHAVFGAEEGRLC